MKETLTKVWRRYKERLLLGLFLLAAFIFSIVLLTFENSFLANVAFLVLGALVAMVTVLVGDAIKRPSQARDLAQALYAELADRVARCCFDCEAPWNELLKKAGPWQMDSVRLRKFLPINPIIYSSTASQLAMLKGEAPQALIQFYYRLAAWQRDIESIAAESQENPGGIAPDNVHLLAIRVQQTLPAGLRALQALAPMVDKHEEIEAAAIAGYDEFRKGVPSEPSLRRRISKLVALDA